MFASFNNGGTTTELWIDNNRDAYISILINGTEVSFFKIGNTYQGPTDMIEWANVPTSACQHILQCLALLRTMSERRYDPYQGICEVPPEFAPLNQKAADRLAHLDVLMSQFQAPKRKRAPRDKRGRFIKHKRI